MQSALCKLETEKKSFYDIMQDLGSKEGAHCQEEGDAVPFPMDFEDKWTITLLTVSQDFLIHGHGFNRFSAF